MVCMQMKKPLMMVAAVMMAALSTMAQSGVFVRTEAELNDAIATYPKGTAILSANITLSNYVGIPAGSKSRPLLMIGGMAANPGCMVKRVYQVGDHRPLVAKHFPYSFFYQKLGNII